MADTLVVITGTHPLVAQHAQSVGDRMVVRRDHAAFAARDVLGRVEREATHAERADGAAVDGRAMRLRRVFHERDTAISG